MELAEGCQPARSQPSASSPGIQTFLRFAIMENHLQGAIRREGRSTGVAHNAKLLEINIPWEKCQTPTCVRLVVRTTPVGVHEVEQPIDL
eukprot:65086-Hanusia_phi.AAC.5